jgi:5'/3'-nucleotidase SurE
MKPLALLTNDDGYASPGLRALRRELAADYETIVVAPAHAKSWIGKALSNPGPLRLETQRVDDQLTYVVHDGTPADCANLSIYHVCPRKPDVVVAGINIGANFTTSLALASGTVGGALEAAVNGVLGVAVSLDLDAATEQRLHAAWNETDAELFAPAARATKHFLRDWFARAAPPRVKLINLIVPQHFAEPPRFLECVPLVYEYGAVFEKRGELFWNRRRGFIENSATVTPASDVWHVKQGHIAYTGYAPNLERIPLGLQNQAAENF